MRQEYFWIKATWIGDEKKSVLVDIASEESLQYLQSKIGERMEETYQDFRGLRHCKATVIYIQTAHKTWKPLIGVENEDASSPQEVNPLQPLRVDKPQISQGLIKDCLKNGDHIFFEIQAIDLWLNIQIDLCFENRRILKGKFQFKVNKSANLLSLKKKLQKFAIEIWTYKNQPRNLGESGGHASG